MVLEIQMALEDPGDPDYLCLPGHQLVQVGLEPLAVQVVIQVVQVVLLVQENHFVRQDLLVLVILMVPWVLLDLLHQLRPDFLEVLEFLEYPVIP